jgi:hypothetical protein
MAPGENMLWGGRFTGIPSQQHCARLAIQQTSITVLRQCLDGLIPALELTSADPIQAALIL